jgi:hypothetical protein
MPKNRANSPNKNLFNPEKNQKMENPSEEGKIKENPILIDDEEENQAPLSDFESAVSLVNALGKIVADISELSFDDVDIVHRNLSISSI